MYIGGMDKGLFGFENHCLAHFFRVPTKPQVCDNQSWNHENQRLCCIGSITHMQADYNIIFTILLLHYSQISIEAGELVSRGEQKI